MRKSIITIALLALVLLFASLTACTAKKETTEDNTEPTITPIEVSGEVYENEATGIGIVFPQEYIGKYSIEQSDVDSFSVIHKATSELYKGKDPSYSLGWLFGIERWLITDEEAINNMNVLATPLFQTDEYAYFLRRPTGVEYDESTPEPWQTTEYKVLYDDRMIAKIVGSAYPLDNANIPEHALAPSGKPWFNENPFQRGVFWFGMTFDEATQAFSENGLGVGEFDSRDNLLAANHSQEVQHLMFNANGKLDYIFIMVRPHFIEEYTGITRMYTEKGIGLGDTFEKVEALYGKPDRIVNEDDRRSVVYSYKMDEEAAYYLLFVANGLPDVVDSIVYNAIDDTMQQKDEIPESLLSWNFAFDDNGIMDAKEYNFPSGEKRLYEPNEYILWLEGTFVSAKVYELSTGMYDMELWLPLNTLPELEKNIANGTKYNGRMEEMDGQTLVESGEAAEALGLGKATIPGWGEREKTEYTNYAMGSAGDERQFWFAYNPILYIGATPHSDYPLNYGVVLKTLKENMNKSYSALVNVLEKNDYTTEQLERLRERIDTTDFAVQYDQFYVFTGPYCILWDNDTGSTYFYTFAHGMGNIWRADFNDAELFTPMYFAD